MGTVQMLQNGSEFWGKSLGTDRPAHVILVVLFKKYTVGDALPILTQMINLTFPKIWVAQIIHVPIHLMVSSPQPHQEHPDVPSFPRVGLGQEAPEASDDSRRDGSKATRCGCPGRRQRFAVEDDKEISSLVWFIVIYRGILVDL